MTSVRDMARGGLTRRALILATPSLLVPGAAPARAYSKSPSGNEYREINTLYEPSCAGLTRVSSWMHPKTAKSQAWMAGSSPAMTIWGTHNPLILLASFPDRHSVFE